MAFLAEKEFLPGTLARHDHDRAAAALAGTRIGIASAPDWAAWFRALTWPRDTALVCDNNTWQAGAAKVVHALQAEGHRVTLINLGSNPKPTMQLVHYAQELASPSEALIAVGSGTINDVVKFAAHRLGKPYAVCGTAPSMNGYLSANAAIMVDGHKQSLAATLPRAALFDLEILQKGPERLMQAGFGDSICRSTAQADWLLSHLLLDTPYDALPFQLLAPFEEKMMQGDMQSLISTLLLSGLGMTLAGGSYPASQGEHLLAHYMEMRFPEEAHKSYHGEQIAVTTLFMASLQQNLLALETAPPFPMESILDEKACLSHFGEEAGAHIWQEWKRKCAMTGAVNERPSSQWDAIREQVAAVTLPVKTLESTLTRLNAPRTVQEIGWNPDHFREAARYAPFIRNRFTFLDLVAAI